MIALLIAAAIVAAPSHECEAPAYRHEERAIRADTRYQLREVSTERERAASVYARCRATGAAPAAREDALAGVNLATAATYAWMFRDHARGCSLMARGIALIDRARREGPLSPDERQMTGDVLREFRHDLRDGRARWFRDGRRHSCAFDGNTGALPVVP